jgi:hypothetical protein
MPPFVKPAPTHIFIDLAGKRMVARVGVLDRNVCVQCGMGTYAGEYHPWTACALFLKSRDSRAVRMNLMDVIRFARESVGVPDDGS